jgi:hypothetical protein
MELFNKALFLSQQKIFALTHRRVYTLMVNLFHILNQFVLLFRKNVVEKSSMIWRVLPLVKINTRITETPCIYMFVPVPDAEFEFVQFRKLFCSLWACTRINTNGLREAKRTAIAPYGSEQLNWNLTTATGNVK